jgi:hypothetical protein
VLGTDTSNPYTVGTTDPALYRNILTVTLDAQPQDGHSGGTRHPHAGRVGDRGVRRRRRVCPPTPPRGLVVRGVANRHFPLS